MVFKQDEIEEGILHHFEQIFSGKRHPVHTSSHNPAPSNVDQVLNDIDEILGQQSPHFQPCQFEDQICAPYTYLELDQILEKLPLGKASGYDKVSNELLRNSSSSFRHYLMIFLNTVLKNGNVPEELNLGKCMLIHKVR